MNAQQHLITSLGFCLKGHKGHVCDCESSAGTNVKTEGPLTAILFLVDVFFFKPTLKTSRATTNSELAN